MITLYHCMSARSFRPLWALEELELPYTLKMLPFPPRVTNPEYLEENPLGTVPLLINNSTRMTESSAMIQYLCSLSNTNQLQVAPDEEAYGAYLNYLHFGEATLTFPLAIVLRYSRFEPDPKIAADYTRWFLSRLRTLEPILEKNQYICANRFTGADISIGYAIMVAKHLGLGDKIRPSTQHYWQMLQDRPAFQRSLKAQEFAAVEQGIPTTIAMDV